MGKVRFQPAGPIEWDIRPPMAEAITIPVGDAIDEGIAVYIAVSPFPRRLSQAHRLMEIAVLIESAPVACDLLAWLAQIDGTVTIHGGVAVDESGMSVDLNQWWRKLPEEVRNAG